MYPFNVAAANKLLDDAGVPRQGDGTRFQMRLIYESARSEWKEVAEVLRANWEPLGVRLVIEPAERAVMLDKVFKKRDFDMTLQSYTSSGDPALGVTRAYACEGDENPPNFGNPTGYCNKELDKLFTDAAKEPDFEKRRAIYRQAQKILAEELPIVVFMGDTDAGLGDKKFNFAPAVASYSRATKWESVHRLP
jgi:peptide/nickel transport system substrate-binding protein